MATYLSLLETGLLITYFAGASAYLFPSLLVNRIIGGSETTLEDLPYQLALEGAPNGRHTCGASVLATYWALTAAHCVYNKPLRSLRFRAGSTVRGEGGSLHPVKFYLYHDMYRGNTLDYDLALVNVKVPFRFGAKVQPAVLPRAPPQRWEPVVVSGWGFLEKEQLRKPKSLVAAEVFVRPWTECKKIYPNLTPRMLCAGADDVDFCSGDSGGPLARTNREQIGVVSWLYKCGDGLPGVYTNVSAMVPWIEASLSKYGVFMNTDTEQSSGVALVRPGSNTGDVIMFPNKK